MVEVGALKLVPDNPHLCGPPVLDTVSYRQSYRQTSFDVRAKYASQQRHGRTSSRTRKLGDPDGRQPNPRAILSVTRNTGAATCRSIAVEQSKARSRYPKAGVSDHVWTLEEIASLVQ